MSNLLLFSGPAVEPVTIAEAKAFLRLDTADDDALVAAAIVAARQACESFTGRALITQSWQLYLDHWPERDITLPHPPLQSVTSIKTFDADGVGATLDPATYWVDASALPGRVRRCSDAVWPSPGRDVAGIEITFVAGYGDSWNEVPQSLRQGILMTIANFYEYRDALHPVSLPAPIAALWQPYRLVRL